MGGALSRLVIFLALATLLAAPASSALAADPPKCKLVRIAEWPVRLQRNLPIIDGTINGNKVGILLDTGSMASVVTTATAEKLNLPMEASGQRIIEEGRRYRA